MRAPLPLPFTAALFYLSFVLVDRPRIATVESMPPPLEFWLTVGLRLADSVIDEADPFHSAPTDRGNATACARLDGRTGAALNVVGRCGGVGQVELPQPNRGYR